MRKDSRNTKGLDQSGEISSLNSKGSSSGDAAPIALSQSLRDEFAPKRVYSLVIGKFLRRRFRVVENNSRGQVTSGYLRTAPKNNRAFNHVGKLANVSWPVIGDKLF